MQPLNEIVSVKSIENAEGISLLEGIAFAGEHVTVVLNAVDSNTVVAGSVVVDPSAPLPITRTFRAKVMFFSIMYTGFKIQRHCLLHLTDCGF